MSESQSAPRALRLLDSVVASFRDDPVARRALSHGLVVLPVVFVGAMLAVAVLSGTLAVDAANNYLPALRDLIHGRTPYHLADIPHGTVFASPPIAAFVIAPFLLVPMGVAEWGMAFGMLACVLGALRLVGVRDWRCFAVVCLWLPTLFEFQTANLSGLLVLLTAAVWRYRDRWAVAALAAGLLVALKLYGWPVIVFLLVSRRFRAAAGAGVVAAALALVPWAAVGFRGLGGYTHLLGVMTDAESREGYWAANVFATAVSWRVAELCTYAVGIGLLALAARSIGDERKLVACLAAMLVLTPILWLHYFVVLLVIVALISPSLGGAWLVPLVLWLASTAQEHPHGGMGNSVPAWQVILVWLCVGGLFVRAYRAGVRRRDLTRRASPAPSSTSGESASVRFGERASTFGAQPVAGNPRG